MGYYQLRGIELSEREDELIIAIQELERDGLPHNPHSFAHYRRYEDKSYSYQEWMQEPDWFADDMLYISLIIELEEIPRLIAKYEAIVSDIIAKPSL